MNPFPCQICNKEFSNKVCASAFCEECSELAPTVKELAQMIHHQKFLLTLFSWSSEELGILDMETIIEFNKLLDDSLAETKENLMNAIKSGDKPAVEILGKASASLVKQLYKVDRTLASKPKKTS